MKTTSSTEQNQKRAFTLVELVVVIAILALLAAMSLPALCKTNIKSNGLQCVSNMKSLAAAWLMFSTDNNDKLLSSYAAESIRWVNGNVDNSAGADFIDLNKYLPASPLNPYLGGNVKVYKCPSDARVSSLAGYVGTPVCRSVSMNVFIRSDASTSGGYLVYKKISDLNRPGPANTFVILDENRGTINDASFYMDMATYDPNNLPGKSWIDVPSAYHSNAGTLSFADGHVEMHRWTDPRTSSSYGFGGGPSPNNLDIDWLQSKTTAKITNPTR